ncbi:MAG: SPOR domain-containing protein [Bacteroidetes bacterium]|nr:SPOR domain-containing protein [Bacteroidota bacterium]
MRIFATSIFDIMDVRIIIAHLLEEHDCVILPGFGGFIGNYAPARIDPLSHSFVPPSKKILFNINLKQNDGLLCNRIVTDEGVSYADALAMVNELVTSIRHHLKSGKSFIFPDVGRLYAGREGTLQFEQEKGSNLLPDAFGLQTFVSPPVSRNSYSDRFEKVLVTRQREISPSRRQFPTSLKWAAMLAIPIGAAAIIGITQYDKLRNPSVNNAGILSSVFSRFSASSLVEKKEAPARGPEINYDFGAIPSMFNDPSASNSTITGSSADPDMDQLVNSARDAANRISDNNTITANQEKELNKGLTDIEEKTPSVVAAATSGEDSEGISKSNNFAIIIGAFKIRENATKCVQDANSKGLNAGIYDRSRSGLYRVALSTTNKKKEAESLLSDARSKGFSGAWLLAK